MARPPLRTRSLVVVLMVTAFAFASCSTSTGSDRGAGDDPFDTVVLQGVDTVEIDPFTESVATAQFTSFSSRVTDAISAALAGFDAAAGAMRTIPGDTPGLYGGTGDAATCDLGALNGFLADPANADKAEAFAAVLGIEVDDIGDSLDGFTTVVLSVDLFVTNHGFRDGAANPFAAVLQAGTAVAVDRNGVPRVKCGCGNPLAPAPAGMVLDDAPTSGDAWPGWNPAEVATAGASAQPVDDFELIDVETGETYRRPAGAVDPCAGDTDAQGHGPDCDTPDDTASPQAPTTDLPPASPPPAGETPDTAPATPDPDDASWGVTGGAASPDDDFNVLCSPDGQFEPVYGTGPYEMSSSVCTAAVHAGVITREAGGMVTIREVPGGPMGGSTAHGVTSEPTGNPRGFFAFV